MRELVETGVDFAHFCARASGEPHLLGAGGLAGLFARGLPQFFAGGFARARFLAGTGGIAGIGAGSLPFLVAGAAGGPRRFAQARRVPVGVAIRGAIAVAILVGL
jgi:hypothetical protein